MSGPPPASSWAAPPEFYLDENAVTRTVYRFLVSLGYRVHTPGEVFGSKADGYGAPDTEWLAKVARTGWVVLNRDAKIMERPHELAAYHAAAVHMFYLPGAATRDQLRHLVEINLADICGFASSRTPNLWRLTERGVVPISPPKPRRRGKRPR